MAGKFVKCTKCNRDYSGIMCPNGCSVIKVEMVDIKKMVENKPMPKSLNQKKEIDRRGDEVGVIGGMGLYTYSYLNKKLKMHHDSIKNEITVIKVGDKYVFKEDIINMWKDQNIKKTD